MLYRVATPYGTIERTRRWIEHYGFETLVADDLNGVWVRCNNSKQALVLYMVVRGEVEEFEEAEVAANNQHGVFLCGTA